MKAKLEASFAQYLVRLFGWILISVITLGIGSIWVAYDQWKWPVENSSLNGRQVRFTASFVDFLGRFLLWTIISIVTLGVGAIWVVYDAPKWVVEHIEFEGQSFGFNGAFSEFLGKIIIWTIVTIVTFGFGGIWVGYDALKWIIEHSVYAGRMPVHFTSTFTDFIGKSVIWFLVTMITLGIGGLWAGYDYYCWLADRIVVEQLPGAAPASLPITV